jgi:hypothetical protein
MSKYPAVFHKAHYYLDSFPPQRSTAAGADSRPVHGHAGK